MKQCLLFILLLSLTKVTLSQPSDFIVLKKRNNRTLKTYFPGAFITATTFNGFLLNGEIKAIRHDSVIVIQQERRLEGTTMGTTIDTVYNIVGVDYHEIKAFHYKNGYTSYGQKRGFVEIAIPKLLIYGGLGFITLEVVNSLYRNESLSANNKLPSLGIAAGVAATGFLIQYLQNRSEKAGPKYKIIYVKNTK